MKVNELIKLLQESVEEDFEVGEYDVYLDIHGSESAELSTIHISTALKYVDLESE